MHTILVVDDDRETCRFITELIAAESRRIVSEQDPASALRLLRQERVDLMVSDINLNASQSGLDLLRAFKVENPDGQVLLISGFGTLETAIEAVRAGAFDYISKPFNIAEVKAMVNRALAHVGPAESVAAPHHAVKAPGLIGRTSGMLAVYKQIAYAADSAAPVLILGESGTGKELVARAIHGNGPRASRPFVAINCGAIPETLLESELFGHTRGAFTGAVTDRKGIIEQASGGTVLLDEIGETSLALQVRLLRTIEEGEVRPVGAGRTVKVDARVISATNRDLEKEVAAQRFRQDLYYRLSVIVITVPPLRERRSDIPLLVAQFLQNASARAGRTVELAPEALDALTGYDWPGNVRELENTIERLVLFSRGSSIHASDLPPAISAVGASTQLHDAHVRGPAVARRARAPIPAPRPARRCRQPHPGGRGDGHRSAHALSDGDTVWAESAAGRGGRKSTVELVRIVIRHGNKLDAAAMTSAASSSSCSGGTVRRSSRTRSFSILAMTGGRCARSADSRRVAGSAIATRCVGSVVPGALPPPMVERPLDDVREDARGGDPGRQRIRATADRVRRQRDHVDDRNRVGRAAGGVLLEGGLEGGVGHLVRPDRAHQRVLTHGGRRPRRCPR